jgi:hypothetical protein
VETAVVKEEWNVKIVKEKVSFLVKNVNKI